MALMRAIQCEEGNNFLKVGCDDFVPLLMYCLAKVKIRYTNGREGLALSSQV